MHDPHQPKQTLRTPLQDVPRMRHVDAARQRMLVAVGVTISSLVIVGLYAASFRYQRVLTSSQAQQLPRWGVLSNDTAKTLDALRQQADAINGMRQTIEASASVQAAQAKGMAIMKEKLMSATATPQKK